MRRLRSCNRRRARAQPRYVSTGPGYRRERIFHPSGFVTIREHLDQPVTRLGVTCVEFGHTYWPRDWQQAQA